MTNNPEKNFNLNPNDDEFDKLLNLINQPDFENEIEKKEIEDYFQLVILKKYLNDFLKNKTIQKEDNINKVIDILEHEQNLNLKKDSSRKSYFKKPTKIDITKNKIKLFLSKNPYAINDNVETFLNRIEDMIKEKKSFLFKK
jgi:hypothetical protein